MKGEHLDTKIVQNIRKNLRKRGYTKITILHTRIGDTDYYHVTADDPIIHKKIAFGFHTVEDDQKG